MNSGENSNSLNLSKNTLKQKKLDHFGITGNLVQGKGTQSENISIKRKNDENIKSTITATLQELEGLSGQALLRKILENKLYTLYDDNKHVYYQSCQKPITLRRSNDGARLKEHIITPMHIGKS
ncbi:9491_t:CDS:2 [Funneliformis caledonium]|uniref:9491_t:CDS:1 n=1 Tax=Funneliformis caledonium TaxID=1117310 RepID=A0A9N8VB87_9GLOM|nr:9491_t:CDS:2 [Funneliformis caledonium]